MTCSPMPHMTAPRSSRQTATSAPMRPASACQSMRVAASGSARCNARNSAPASAEPPPRPAATGIDLSRTIAQSRTRPGALAPTKSVTRSSRLGPSSGAGLRAGDGQAALARRIEGNDVGWCVGETDEALDRMIAVRPAAEHAKGQVDLGPCSLGEFRHRRLRLLLTGTARTARAVSPRASSASRPSQLPWFSWRGAQNQARPSLSTASG